MKLNYFISLKIEFWTSYYQVFLFIVFLKVG